VSWEGVESPFLGRGPELATVAEAINESATGRTLVVLIGGESGIGKTRLILEAARAVEGRATVLFGSAIDIAEKRPFWPIIDALRRLLGNRDADWAVRAVEPWRDQLSRLLSITLPTIPETGSLADGHSRSPSTVDLPEVELLSQSLTRLAQDRPLVLVLEDLQWADRSTRDFLVFALANLLDVPLLIISSYRSDAVSRTHPLRQLLPELGRNRRVRLLHLAPVERSAIAEFVAANNQNGVATSSDIEALVWLRSEGNFFLAEETLRAARNGVRDEVPLTLRQMVLGRIDSLAADVHEVLHAIAAADEPVDHDLLTAVTRMSTSDLLGAVRSAVDTSILVADREQSTYRFRHALYREVIASELLPGEQQDLHRRFAQALSTRSSGDAQIATRLAHHWDRAHEWSKALEATIAAAENALNSHGYAEAHAHWMRSLQLIERISPAAAPAARVDLLERTAASATLTGEHLQAVALMRERIRLDGDASGAEAARLHQHLARYLAAAGDSKAALDAHAAAVAFLSLDADPSLRASVLSGFAHALMASGQYASARVEAERAAALAEECGASSEHARALATLGFSLTYLEDPTAGLAVLQKALRIAEEAGSATDVGWVIVNLAELHSGPLNLLDEAVTMARAGAERVRTLGLERTTGVELRAVAANTLFRLGRWTEAEAELSMALAARPTGSQAIELRLARARLLVGWGDIEEAEVELEALDLLLAESVWPRDRIPLLTLRAGLALWQGRTAAACEAVLAGLDIVDPESDDLWLLAPLVWHGLRAIGDDAELALSATAAKRQRDGLGTAASRAEIVFIERMRLLVERAGATDAVSNTVTGYLQLCEGELSRSRREPNPDVWSRAAETWENLGHPYPTAYAWFRHADSLFSLHARAAGGLTALRRSYRIALSLNAQPLIAEITSLATRARLSLEEPAPRVGPSAASPRQDGNPAVVFAGDTTPEVTPSLLAELTEREIMVLAEIAQGRTNREIAQHLFISEKTVSAHVSHILSKLGVHSRVQASAHFYRATTASP
jgi:DNA-binding CsgD family transcriptional regulator/tetratricopeptide (TPR) repeat protein